MSKSFAARRHVLNVSVLTYLENSPEESRDFCDDSVREAYQNTEREGNYE